MIPMKRWLIAGATTLAGALYLHWKGPVPVVRVFDTLPIDAPLWYMLSAFPILGLLLADLEALARDRRWKHCAELCVQVGVMVLLSHSRLELRIPISGHALLFMAFLLRRAWSFPPSAPHRTAELVLGALGVAMVAGVKLLWWQDPVTLGVGLLTALAMSWIGRRALRSQPD